jgi:hypothetical protein
MRAIIDDPEVLLTVRPSDMIAYARAQGWTRTRHIGGGGVWSRDSKNLLLPENRGAPDYAARVADFIRGLEKAEDRSQLDILADIRAALADVVRLQFVGRKFNSGTAPLGIAAHIVGHARDMVLAAANAVVEHRPVYYGYNRPEQVTEMLDHAQFGQTEQGSFIMTILAPLPTVQSGETPFARKVTSKLLTTADVLRDAVVTATSEGTLAAFDDALKEGVSANLCEAIGGLVADGAEEVALTASWSPSQPIRRSTPSRAVFTEEDGEVLLQAGRRIRDVVGREDFKITGYVFALKRHRAQKSGQVTIQGYFDGGWRQVRVVLPDADYENMMTAHRRRLLVTCTGTLARDGRSWTLRNPRSVRAIEPEM